MKTKNTAKATKAESNERWLAPRHIGPHDWYYEYPSHLCLVHEVRDKNGNYIQTDTFKLPWRMIEQSRKRRKPKRKRAPMCGECNVNRSDPPSKLCPGCQAYAEHQQ